MNAELKKIIEDDLVNKDGSKEITSLDEAKEK